MSLIASNMPPSSELRSSSTMLREVIATTMHNHVAVSSAASDKSNNQIMENSITQTATLLWKKFIKRLRTYLAINLFVVAVAVLSYSMVSWGTQTSSLFAEASSIYVSSVIRMLGTVFYFEGFARLGGIKRIDGQPHAPMDMGGDAWNGLFFIAGVCEVINMMYSTRYAGFGFVAHTESYFLEYLIFIPKSLLLELIFDFFHYWSHRYFHRNKFLFRLVHAEHHSHLHLTPIDTYAQTYLEVILTNMIPLFLAFRCGPTMSLWQFHLFMSYKTFIEVAGHAGLDSRGPSFPQCPLLGWCTDGVILRTQDHDWHHTKPTCNFSKRFSLWDRLFGTYEEPNHRQKRSRINKKQA